jgi:hypothetical protein
MCSLCDTMGNGSFWTDAAGRAEFEASGERVTPRRERARRVQLANLILREFGLKLSDWSGSAYVIESNSGASEIVYHLNGIWSAAERLSGRRCDPLDPTLIARLAQVAGEARSPA